MDYVVGISLDAIPLFPYVVAAGLLVSVLLTRPLARWSGLPWPLVFGLCVSSVIALAATLSPAGIGLAGACLTTVKPPIWWLYGRPYARALNTFLFMPLGFFVGLAALRRPVLLPVAFAMPLLVETAQLVIPALHRRCQVQDLIDNYWGLLLGTSVGIAVALLIVGLTPAQGREQRA